jgi:hypothetical protein
MARVNSILRPIGIETQPEASDTASEEVVEVLLSMVQSSVGVVVSPSREGSEADTSDNSGDCQSDCSNNELTMSDLDSSKKAMVAAAAASVGKTFDLGTSTMARDRVRTQEGLSFFAKGFSWAPGSETVLEPWIDKDVVFEDLFITGPHMPPHLVLTDILQNFEVQLHQLTPNTIIHLSKFIWEVSSCGGQPTAEVFAKYYELHYQQKKIKRGESDEALSAQFGCITFHPVDTEVGRSWRLP